MKRGKLMPVLAVVVLAGCAAPKAHFEAKKAAPFQGKLERVLVVYPYQETATTLGRDFSEQVARRLVDELRKRGVAAEAAGAAKEELDREAPLRAAASRFGPRQVLAFSVSKWTTRRVGAPGGYTQQTLVKMEFSIWDAGTQQTVWRATADFGWAAPSPEEAAEQVIQRLVTDGML